MENDKKNGNFKVAKLTKKTIKNDAGFSFLQHLNIKSKSCDCKKRKIAI